MWLRRAPRTGRRCAPRCRGKGTGEQAGEVQGSRNKPGKGLGTRAKAPGPRAPIQEETPLLSEMPGQPSPGAETGKAAVS